MRWISQRALCADVCAFLLLLLGGLRSGSPARRRGCGLVLLQQPQLTIRTGTGFLAQILGNRRQVSEPGRGQRQTAANGNDANGVAAVCGRFQFPELIIAALQLPLHDRELRGLGCALNVKNEPAMFRSDAIASVADVAEGEALIVATMDRPHDGRGALLHAVASDICGHVGIGLGQQHERLAVVLVLLLSVIFQRLDA